MQAELILEAFSLLGDDLRNFGRDQRTRQVIAEACNDNPWFTPAEVIIAVDAIRERMLDRDRLEQWRARYPAVAGERAVGVIMAGNIPLVGFFDILCVLAAGHRCLIKPSSRDTVLINYMIERLRDIFHDIPVEPLANSVPDAVIATGGENAKRLFGYRYRGLPVLTRGSMFSVAVLTGSENDEQITALADDIFLYSGLGCRSVSHLLLPAVCDIGHLATVLSERKGINPKYINNYRQAKALADMNGLPHIDGKFFILTEDDSPSRSISNITYSRYCSVGQRDKWLDRYADSIQCVVCLPGSVSDGIPFGQSQFPGLTQYADRIDTMRFLTGLP